MDQNGHMTYIIEYAEGNSPPKEVLTGSSSTEYTLSNLVPNTEYLVRVAGWTNAGKGPFSTYNSITTDKDCK